MRYLPRLKRAGSRHTIAANQKDQKERRKKPSFCHRASQVPSAAPRCTTGGGEKWWCFSWKTFRLFIFSLFFTHCCDEIGKIHFLPPLQWPVKPNEVFVGCLLKFNLFLKFVAFARSAVWIKKEAPYDNRIFVAPIYHPICSVIWFFFLKDNLSSSETNHPGSACTAWDDCKLHYPSGAAHRHALFSTKRRYIFRFVFLMPGRIYLLVSEEFKCFLLEFRTICLSSDKKNDG